MAPVSTVGSSRRRAVIVEDPLSSLPDGLLHTIMSFLTAQQAVQTCVLSRRWENLWRSMPCLNIDEQDFDIAASGAMDHFERPRGRFEEFVNNLLMFHSAPSLDMFRFHVTQSYEFNVVDRWLRGGIKGCPAVVEVYRSGNARFYGLPHLGSSACRLKRLHLIGIALKNSFAQQLRSGCPVLEDLILERCLLDPPEITSCTIKNLIVTDFTKYGGKVVAISAPALQNFHLGGPCWDGFLVNEMPCLVNASICLTSYGASSSSSVERPRKLLCSLINVGNLKLSGSKTLSILCKGSDVFPTFCNLRTLLFDECDLSDNFQILEWFLNNAPSLEKLTLQYCKLPEGSRKRKRTENPKRISLKCLETPSFQCPNLKLTEIKYKEDDVHQLFGLLSGVWKNLQKTSILLTKG